DIVVIADVGNVICGGESTGSIDLIITGGASPFTYSCADENGVISTIQDIADVPAGTYYLEISDAQGCTYSETYVITENDPIVATFSVSHPDCSVDNGSISVTLAGGVVSTDYFISWTDLEGNSYPPSSDLTDLGVGTYIFTVSDDNGCELDSTIPLSKPDANIEITATGLSCPGAN